jgi:hypothetical protein
MSQARTSRLQRKRGDNMSFPRNQPRTDPRVRGPIFAVGQRVSVKASGGFPPRVTLKNASGRAACGTLADGSEVEILAWRPGGSRGTLYCVRCTGSGIEGWLGVASLCDPESARSSSETAVPSATTSSVASQAEGSADTGRRFGQR